MRNVIAMLMALSLSLAPAVATAAQWTSRRDVARAAHELSDEAQSLQRRVHRTTYGHLAGDAYRLAYSAERFHQMVEHGAPYQHARRDYQALKDSFFTLRASFMRAHGVHHASRLRRSWLDVAHDFENLALVFGDDGYASCPVPRRDWY